MWQLVAVVFFLAANHVAESRSPSYPFNSYDSYNPSYGPGPQRPFSVPGEIVDGIRVQDILETLGRAWNGDRLIYGAQSACNQFAGVVSDLLRRTQHPEIVHSVCDAILDSRIESVCESFWDLAVGDYYDEGASISLLPDVGRCRESDYYGTDFSSDFSRDFNFSDVTYTTYDLYPTFGKVEQEAMNDVKRLYDFCSEGGQGVEKINNILFAVMDWLGPSLLNGVYGYSYDLSSLCSVGRYILSMSPLEYTEALLAIEKYPVADILEYLRTHDICDKSDNVGFQLLRDLLAEFSDMTEDEFCTYISRKHSREDYLERATTILENAFLISQDEQRCNNILSILVPLDEGGVHFRYVGYDLSVPSQRSEFCQQVISALSLTSSFVPPPYTLPPDVDIHQWEPFSTPGEYLPGLTLIDLLEIEGATWRAETIVEGVGIYCDVFEGLIVDLLRDHNEDAIDIISSICHLAKSGNLEGLEGKCQAFVHDSGDRPIGLKQFHPIPVLIYMARNLTGIADISEEEVCQAADNLFNRSLEDLVQTAMEIFISEGVPPLHSVCQNWEEAVCYWKPYCPEPDFNRAPVQTTESPYYRFYRYTPSEEEVQRVNANFDETLSKVEDIALIVSGFKGREALCEGVAMGIDPASGRAVPEFVESLRFQVLGLLTDVERCSALVNKALEFISDRDAQSILTGGNSNLVYQLTGYSSSEQFCEAVENVFSQGTTATEPSGTPIATYNVFMKIAVYLKDNAPYPF